MSQPSHSPSTSQYLSFFIAGEEYALGILQVREIIEYDTVTRIPGAPPWIRGVTNLRGSVLPVIDLAVKFGLPPLGLSRRACIVVVEVAFQSEKLVLGVLADAVGQVLDFGPGDVEPPPAFGAPIRVDFLTGMGRAGKKFVMLLDINRVLSGQELQATGALRPVEVASGAPAGASGGGTP